jgi:ParB family chromosome partitioning protein
MSEMKSRSPKGLGKGLSALIAEINVDTPVTTNTVIDRQSITELPVELIDPSPYQPRKYFSEEGLRELTDSIRKNGVMQPVIVRVKASRYELIAGERRWRASKLARLNYIPVVVKDLSDKEALEFALIENIQRQDLTPLEEAEGYRRIMDEFAYTQEEISQELGKSRSHIANMLRLLNLPDNVKKLLDDGEITMGHARALIGVEDAAKLAEEVVRRKLNVRQTESLIKHNGQPEPKAAPAQLQKQKKPSYTPTKEKDEDIISLEQTLSQSLGLHVSIEDEGNNGRVIIDFHNLEQLDRILQKLTH